MATVYLIEKGYYEQRGVAAICVSMNVAERVAEEMHPQVDAYFGEDPRCEHWSPDPKEKFHCAGCTMMISPIALKE